MLVAAVFAMTTEEFSCIMIFEFLLLFLLRCYINGVFLFDFLFLNFYIICFNISSMQAPKRVRICPYSNWNYCCRSRKALTAAVDYADFDHVIHPIPELNGLEHEPVLRLRSCHPAPNPNDSMNYLIDGSWQPN